MQATWKRRRRVMTLKALKLEVPLTNRCARHLGVKTGHKSPKLRRPYKVDDCWFEEGPHVESLGNDVLLVKDFFGANNRVPDVIRYRICAEGCYEHPDDGRYHICNNRYIIPCSDVPVSQLQPGNIVLLLESPHEDEFEYINGGIGSPKKPACGSTGANIDKCLGNVLSRIEDQGLILPGRHIIISNPIQFQTSLHAIHRKSLKGRWKTLRDNVWKTLWEEPQIKQGFRQRLLTYRPSLIINACTGAFDQHDDNDPKGLVNNILNNEFSPLYKTKHPAINWNIPCDGISIPRINPQPE